MARIGLVGTSFEVLPEGHYTFTITGVQYDEDFGSMKVKMTTDNGKYHTEKYQLKNADGEYNDGAMSAFSVLAKVALNDFERQDVDPEELVGRKFEADCVHDVKTSNRDPNKTVTFVRLNNKTPVPEEDSAAPAPSESVDLDSLLG